MASDIDVNELQRIPMGCSSSVRVVMIATPVGHDAMTFRKDCGSISPVCEDMGEVKDESSSGSTHQRISSQSLDLHREIWHPFRAIPKQLQ